MSREWYARYSLLGDQGERAVAAGLADADWFRSEVPRARMKELMRRSDAPGVRDTAIWLGAMVGSGVLAWWFWSGWLAVPFLVVYGLLYGSASEARRHEANHGTAFKTRGLSTFVFHVASFCTMREPTVWRWQHTRHHTDTLIVGRDPEIEVMRPARLLRVLANFFGLVNVPASLWVMVVHSAGRLTPEERTFVPASEEHKVFVTSRVWLAIYAGVAAVCLASGSILPVLLVGGPNVYGVFLLQVYGLTQHTGMSEDVLDHRLNSRTVHMNRLNRFMYWNMNYHVEHHMFPMVPYWRLPELHEEIKRDLAPPYPSIWAAYREIVPAVIRQLSDPSYGVHRELPPGAAPFRLAPEATALLEGTAR